MPAWFLGLPVLQIHRRLCASCHLPEYHLGLKKGFSISGITPQEYTVSTVRISVPITSNMSLHDELNDGIIEGTPTFPSDSPLQWNRKIGCTDMNIHIL